MIEAIVLSFLGHLAPVLAQQLPPPPSGGGEGKSEPRLIVTKRHVDLGKILEGDKVKLEWLLENEGQADLVIDRVHASCGCTVVNLSDADKTVPPGKSLRLEAEFDSTGRGGRQEKSITVHSNDPLVPTMKLEFSAQVEALYTMKPSANLNLRDVQRGEFAATTLELMPGKGRRTVEPVSVEIKEGDPLTWKAEPFEDRYGHGQRVRFGIDDSAGLGTVNTRVTIHLKVDGIERKREVPLRARIVGELTASPKVLDETRHLALPGKKLREVTVRAMNKKPFKVLEATAGSILDVDYEPTGSPLPESEYAFHLTVRQDAPAGPFGVTLQVRTNSLDQPIVQVPVYGIVVPAITVEPRLILLRQDGTPVGRERLVRLQASTGEELRISTIHCASENVTAQIEDDPGNSSANVQLVRVKLTGELPEGIHESTLVLNTGVVGAKVLEIPVVIEVPP